MVTKALVGGSSVLASRVAEQVKAKFFEESSGHDWHHINRVRKLAWQIVGQEDANQEVAELAALVHDIADWKFHGGDDTIGPREAERLLAKELAPKDVIVQVVDTSLKWAARIHRPPSMCLGTLRSWEVNPKMLTLVWNCPDDKGSIGEMEQRVSPRKWTPLRPLLRCCWSSYLERCVLRVGMSCIGLGARIAQKN